MRRAAWILPLLAVSLSASAQPAIEVIPPATIGDVTATWTVVLTNPDAQATPPQLLASGFGAQLTTATLISVPAGCTVSEGAYAQCPGFVLGAGERRELTYTVRYGGRFGTFGGTVQYAGVFAHGELEVRHHYAVTTTADDGPGSLRQALVEMNQNCTNDSEGCSIVFQIDGPPPAEGWFTIRPLSPLPPVTARYATIDGRTQTLHTGDTNPAGPELMLDGSSTWHHGLQFDGGDVLVTDVAIGNFQGNGIASAARIRTRIDRCHLGMDPSGTRRAPNGLRGAQIEGGQISVTNSILGGNFRAGGWFDTNSHVSIIGNRFIDNGASGLYAKTFPGTYNNVLVENNVISGNAHAGISLDRQSIGNYAGNHFHGNLGRAIDIGIDGPTQTMVPGLPGRGGIIGAPVITSTRYENGETIIEARRAPRGPNTHLGDYVYFYASPVPKDGGELLGRIEWYTNGHSDIFTLRVPRDLRGQWVSAATYGIYVFNWDDGAPGTSEAGEPRLVE